MDDSPAVRIKKAFGDPLLKDGFQRKGPTWWWSNADLIHVINLQKCDWSESWYVNVGFYIRKGDPSVLRPAENQCHFGYRLDSIFPDRRAGISKLLDLTVSMDLEERISELRSIAGDVLLPFLRALRTLEALKAEYPKPWFSDGLVTVKGRKLLGLPPPAADS